MSYRAIPTLDALGTRRSDPASHVQKPTMFDLSLWHAKRRLQPLTSSRARGKGWSLRLRSLFRLSPPPVYLRGVAIVAQRTLATLRALIGCHSHHVTFI